MWDLLTSQKTVLAAQIVPGGTIPKIKSIKRGVLPPRFEFPVIGVMPVQEQVLQYRSSGRLEVSLTTETYIYFKDFTGERAIQVLSDYADAVKTIYTSNYQLPDSFNVATVKAVTVGSIVYTEENSDNQRIHTAQMTTSYRCAMDLPTTTITHTAVDNPTTGSIAQDIFDDIDGLRATTLSRVRELHFGKWGPFVRFPAVIVRTSQRQTAQKYAGIDLMASMVMIDILSPVGSAKDEVIKSHLELVDDIKDVVRVDLNRGGKAQMSRVDMIEHSGMLANNDLSYVSTITVSSDAKQKVSGSFR